MMKNADKGKIEEILKFWFEETSPKQKFKKDPDFDALITSRFKTVYEDIMNRKTEAWREMPEGRLAEIVVLDQFSRNMFRDDPQSFAAVVLALELAQEAVATGDDKKLPKEWRGAIYMPYMHSESRDVHEEALKLFTEYGNKENLKYEIKHKEIIDHFGRYPHRNKILGRESSSEEIEFLKKHSGF